MTSTDKNLKHFITNILYCSDEENGSKKFIKKNLTLNGKSHDETNLHRSEIHVLAFEVEALLVCIPHQQHIVKDGITTVGVFRKSEEVQEWCLRKQTDVHCIE